MDYLKFLSEVTTVPGTSGYELPVAQAFARLFAPLADGTFMAAMLYLSVLSSIVAFLFINFASNTLPVAKTTAFCNLTTAISMFAGVVFLYEPFGMMSLVASVMIILGVWKVQTAQSAEE